MSRERKSHPYLILFALWLMVFSASSQVIIVSPILPRITESLSVDERYGSLLITSYAVMLSIFALITGPISDKVGRRRILLVGSGFMAAALALHGIANSFVLLLVMRAVAGAAGGTLSGAAVAYVGDYFPYERRGWANGWVMSGIAVGQVVGIPLGTVIADVLNFRWPFLMFAITMAGAVGLIWRVVPQPDVQLAEGKLSLRKSIANYWALMQERDTAAAVAAYFLMFFSIGLYVIYLPTWLEDALDVGGTAIASLFFVGGIATVGAGPLAGHLSDSVGRKPLVVASCAGLGVVMVVTTFVVTDMWVAYPLFGLAMVLISMRISPLQALLSALVSDERRGILMSLAVAIGQVGIGISGAIAGWMYAEEGYVSNTLLGAVAIVLMAAIVWWVLPEPEMDGAPGTAATPSAEPS